MIAAACQESSRSGMPLARPQPFGAALPAVHMDQVMSPGGPALPAG
jgi:hypothetical protein